MRLDADVASLENLMIQAAGTKPESHGAVPVSGIQTVEASDARCDQPTSAPLSSQDHRTCRLNLTMAVGMSDDDLAGHLFRTHFPPSSVSASGSRTFWWSDCQFPATRDDAWILGVFNFPSVMQNNRNNDRKSYDYGDAGS